MRSEELDYELPDSAIAQHPLEPRDSARLLVDGAVGEGRHRRVHDLPDLIDPGTVVVLNDTAVIPARVPILRESGGSGEVLLLEPEGGGWWQALCRPSRQLHQGTVVSAVTGPLSFEFGESLGGGRRLVRPDCPGSLEDALRSSGVVPLPPYINTPLRDPDRYQTVYARRPGSAAAPTAGLHLTDRVLRGIESAGGTLVNVELVIGLDTFKPIAVDRVEDHAIHSEWYRIPESTWTTVLGARAEGRPVLAVGTTSVRALESAAATGELTGRTDLFITPGHSFAAVDRLLTNFHLPRSSLLALLEAAIGPRWRTMYDEALGRRYRFLSFGDASLLEVRR